jgi:hypothetical protein
MSHELKKITEGETELLMETMRANGNSQNNPKVGMFWYNPERNRLAGVHSAYASELPFNAKGRKTMQVLHHTAWPDIREDAIANGSNDAIWREEDYTLVPRGRIFQIQLSDSSEEYFEIHIGSWLNEYPDVPALILKAFNLGQAKCDFIQSEHWDIGRGTSL